MHPWRAMLRFTDAEAELIARWFDARNQMRLGVWMTNLGLGACGYVVRTSEPPLIYEMSALALLFGGIGVVVTAKLAQNDPNSD